MRPVGRPGCVIHGQDNLRHARRRHRLDETRAGADDALMFGLGTDHEAGDILDEEQWNPLSVAALDEERDLFSALGVEDPAEPGFFSLPALDEAALIRDETDADTAYVDVAADDLSR